MDLLVVGYVLHAMACAKVGDRVTRDCVELQERSEPINRGVCERAMAVAVQRVPSIPSEAYGLSGPYHIEFECKAVATGRT